MFSQEIMRRNNGWKFHLLTEDLEIHHGFLAARRPHRLLRYRDSV